MEAFRSKSLKKRRCNTIEHQYAQFTFQGGALFFFGGFGVCWSHCTCKSGGFNQVYVKINCHFLFVYMSSHKFLWRMLFGHLVLNTQLKRFLGIFSWDPSACEFNQLHVHILKFSFIHNFYQLFVDIICYIGKLAHLSMPKFLAGCHYNEEEISRHLKKNIGYCRSKWMATSLQPVKFWKKPVEVVKSWADFSWLSSKVSRTLVGFVQHT